MPPVILERLPLPSLQVYSCVSAVFLSITIFYAVQMTSDPEWRINLATVNVNTSDVDNENETESIEKIKLVLHQLLLQNLISKRVHDIILFICEDSACTWTVINMTYCMLVILVKIAIKVVFGELRSIEQQHMKDKFWNFVFYKFIFIFGVLNVQYVEDVVLWCFWFTLVGVSHLLSQLCRDRFEYLSFSPTTPRSSNAGLFAMIFGILAFSAGISTFAAKYFSISTFCFLSAEWALVALRTLYVLIRHILHMYDVSQEGIWENRGAYAYYGELTFDLSSLSVDFLHHLHMLFRGNIFLSMATLVICLQLRVLFAEIQRKIIRHKNYLRVSRHMESNYPLASQGEIESNRDDCPICWDRMESARKLPCGHMFHTSCLHSWLEQVTNCPTCRTPLVNSSSQSDENRNILGQDDVQPRPANQTTNHFFHFDGSRYVSWFPSFSVEVSHTSLLGDRQHIANPTSQLDTMVNQVLHMFPQLPYNLVMEDLLSTRSVETTVENIIEERLGAVNNLSGSSSNSSSSSNLSVNDEESTPTVSDSSSRNIQAENDHPHSDSHLHSSHRSDEPTMISGGDGCRFSKSSYEREQMLSQRKEILLRRARNKYISKVMPHPRRSSYSSRD